MAQQEPIRVVVEKQGGCFSGCGTVFGVLLLVALAVKYWYISLLIVVLVVAAGAIANSQQKQKTQEPARRRSGPRDPWLNEVAVALAELGLTEFARNTGNQLGGAPMEGDIGLQTKRFLVYVNLFASNELARQAEIGLRAQPNIRQALSNGQTALKTVGPVVYVANGRGNVVDEFHVDEVIRTVAALQLPSALSVTTARTTVAAPAARRDARSAVSATESGGLEQIRKLAELRDSGVLTQEEFDVKKTELLRRI
ncbi:hypothetical protein AYO39_00990 [Actinobacteria bacterium SCGC AG-212-D09]|nr:hypothetical protein AYO39_00990 [Actinobacteria bacterium SCGC AG-212-D09]